MAGRNPRVNELFVKEAVKHLTRKQKKIWDYHSLDGLTQDVIATKMNISQQAVSRHLKAAEVKMIKWFKEHQDVYDLLLEQATTNDDGEMTQGERHAYDWSHKTPTRQSEYDNDY